MKTVLQEFIEQLEKTIPEIKNGNSVDKSFWLQKEKEQITIAYKEGWKNPAKFRQHGSEYYYKNLFIDSSEAGI